jgi:hypothetical protein
LSVKKLHHDKQNTDTNLGLYQRHDMSTKYEQELLAKKTNTLFGKDTQSKSSLVKPVSTKSETFSKEYRLLYIERKKAAKRRQENIKK